jgi:hypothetical protein
MGIQTVIPEKGLYFIGNFMEKFDKFIDIDHYKQLYLLISDDLYYDIYNY